MSDQFSLQNYFNRLKTRSLGRPCIHLDQVGSTIDVASNEKPGTLVVAQEQTDGRGQRNNRWHSPRGCAMASIRLVCAKVTPLASRLCFLQHIVALAIAKTLEGIDDRKLGEDHIRLKWPNDIIYTNPSLGTGQKIGGILVHTLDKGEDYDVTLSFGLNVFNKEPTICISDIIGASKYLSIDSIIADMLNNLERFTEDLEEKKFQDLKSDYIKRCLQINQLIEDELNGRVEVYGVNDDGFLVGKRCSDNKLCTVTKIV